jgi:hypothetical protein
MAFPATGARTNVTDRLTAIAEDAAGAHIFLVYEVTRTTGGDSGQPKVLAEFRVTAAEAANLVTQLGS